MVYSWRLFVLTSLLFLLSLDNYGVLSIGECVGTDVSGQSGDDGGFISYDGTYTYYQVISWYV